ncbi:MAG: hypothetical protein OEM63_10905, partial [Gammaproteobacteria bacterium]|nr:hypothetical protein [Gammaproteobacteria bacterium]
IGGLVLIGLSAYLVDTSTARPLLTVWALVGLPLFLIVFGRMNRETSDGAALMYLVGLAILGLLLLVGIYRIWPLLDQLQESISDFF